MINTGGTPSRPTIAYHINTHHVPKGFTRFAMVNPTWVITNASVSCNIRVIHGVCLSVYWVVGWVPCVINQFLEIITLFNAPPVSCLTETSMAVRIQGLCDVHKLCKTGNWDLASSVLHVNNPTDFPLAAIHVDVGYLIAGPPAVASNCPHSLCKPVKWDDPYFLAWLF